MTNPNLEYIADLTLGTLFTLASYHVNSWALWGIGIGLLALTIVTNNIASWPTRGDRRA